MNATFPKTEHLCSRRLINRLYAEGRRLMVFPYSVLWLEEPSLNVPCQVLIVAPKRKLHHAVDRNRIKRLTRECYRLHKQQLIPILQQRGIAITLAVTYIHNELMTYDQLYHKFDKLVALLEKDLDNEATRTEVAVD